MLLEMPNDPIILLGIINMKLRDFYQDMTILCDDLELDFLKIDAVLNEAGFNYDVQTNQYHPKQEKALLISRDDNYSNSNVTGQ